LRRKFEEKIWGENLRRKNLRRKFEEKMWGESCVKI